MDAALVTSFLDEDTISNISDKTLNPMVIYASSSTSLSDPELCSTLSSAPESSLLDEAGSSGITTLLR